MRYPLRYFDLRLGLALCVLIAGCESNLEPETGPTFVRFVNAAHDAAGPLRFTMAGGPPTELLQQAESSEYVAVEPRVYLVTIEDDVSAWSIADDLQIARGLYQTLIAFGPTTSESGILLGDQPAPAPSGQFLARFLHLAAGVSGAIDIHIVAPLEQLDGNTLARTALEYPSSAEHFRISAGSWRIVLTPTGTTTIMLDSGVLTFESRQAYTFVILTGADGLPALLRLRDGA